MFQENSFPCTVIRLPLKFQSLSRKKKSNFECFIQHTVLCPKEIIIAFIMAQLYLVLIICNNRSQIS